MLYPVGTPLLCVKGVNDFMLKEVVGKVCIVKRSFVWKGKTDVFETDFNGEEYTFSAKYWVPAQNQD